MARAVGRRAPPGVLPSAKEAGRRGHQAHNTTRGFLAETRLRAGKAVGGIGRPGPGLQGRVGGPLPSPMGVLAAQVRPLGLGRRGPGSWINSESTWSSYVRHKGGHQLCLESKENHFPVPGMNFSRGTTQGTRGQ